MPTNNIRKVDYKSSTHNSRIANFAERGVKIFYFLTLLFCVPHTAFSYDAIIQGIYYDLNPDDKIAKVVSGETRYEGDIIIPETVEIDGYIYNVTSIAGSAFHSCQNLSSVVIGKKITYIGSYAFAGCWRLDSLNIPYGVDVIDQKAFYDCIGLRSVIISNSVTYIGWGAFENCRNLSSIYLPDNVTHLDESVFEDCTSLSSVKLSTNVISLKKRVFARCTSLSTIILHDRIMEVQEEAFADCENLKNVYCFNSFVPDTHIRAFCDSNIKNATLYVPEESIDRYKATNPWWNFGTIAAIVEQEVNVNLIECNNMYEKTYYTLDGRKNYRNQKGINIIKNCNGKTTKVFVKP